MALVKINKIKQKNNKWLPKFSIATGTVILTGALVFPFTVSCSFKNFDIFVYSSPTNFLENQNSPLNPTFSNTAIDIYSQSTLLNLLTYRTTGQFEYDENGKKIKTPEDNLYLEAAEKVEAFNEKGDSLGIFERNSGFPITEDYGSWEYEKIVASAVKYKFTIDKNLRWIDSKCSERDRVSGIDFARGLQTYILGSELAYNRNGYFIDMIGLDKQKTLGISNDNPIVSPDFKTDEYDKNDTNDEMFTLYLKSPYPFLLSVLTKSYFAAVPHKNVYVKNIQISPKGKISLTQDSNNKPILDQNKTEFNEIFGSGSSMFLDHTWFAGPYYFEHFSNSQIKGKLNPFYKESMEELDNALLESDEEHIPQFVLNYGTGNPEVFYNRFVNGEQSWVNSIPINKYTEVAKKYLKSGELYLSGYKQLNKSNYIAYTPKPYVYDDDKVVLNNNVSESAAKIIFNWNSKDSLIFRAAISGLINHYKLSNITLVSGDFQLSSIPYGTFPFSSKIDFPNYYTAISEGYFMGGLPRRYKDYIDDNNDNDEDSKYFLFTGDKSSFNMPYYKYDETLKKYKCEKVEINKKSFQDVLKKTGATKNNKAVWQYKYGEGAITSEYNSYLIGLKFAIERLGGGLLEFNLIPRSATTPSATDWFNSQSSSLGFLYWSPDYNHVATWLESAAILNKDSSPGTNIASTFPGIFKIMMICAKTLDVEWNEKNNEYVYNNNISSELFNENPWIDNEFWKNGNFEKIGVKYLNFLIEKKVLNQKEIDSLLKDENSLVNLDHDINNTPNKFGDLTPLQKYFLSAETYAPTMSSFAALDEKNALWLTTVSDMQLGFIPRSEAGLKEIVYNLVDVNFKVRESGVGAINIRDFTRIKKSK